MRTGFVGVVLLVGSLSLAGCDRFVLPDFVAGPEVSCGAYEGPDCNDLIELGLDVLAVGHDDGPLAIAVERACPPNARCVPSSLGGDTAAVVVRWRDGTVDWARIPLPPDWPASPAGSATLMSDPPPAHILPLVGVEAPVDGSLPS